MLSLQCLDTIFGESTIPRHDHAAIQQRRGDDEAVGRILVDFRQFSLLKNFVPINPLVVVYWQTSQWPKRLPPTFLIRLTFFNRLMACSMPRTERPTTFAT